MHAFAAAAPLLLAGLASAAPMAERSTGKVTCSTGIATNMPLYWATPTIGGFNSIYPTGYNGKTFLTLPTNEADQRAGEEEFGFSFESCKSNYMGYTTHADDERVTEFGHIKITRADYLNKDLVGKCLALTSDPYPSLIGEAPIVAVNCSYADDSSQLNQFWQIQNEHFIDDDESKGLNARGYVSYVGVTRAKNGKHGDEAPPVWNYLHKKEGGPQEIFVQKLEKLEEYSPEIYFHFDVKGAKN